MGSELKIAEIVMEIISKAKDTIKEKKNSVVNKLIQIPKLILKFHIDGDSSLVMNIINVSNTVIGGGIISLPYATQKIGLPLSLFLTTLSCLITGYTSYILTLVSIKYKTSSYREITKKNLGNFFWIIHGLCTIWLSLSICIVYSLAITDNVASVFKALLPMAPIFQNKMLILTIFLFLFVMPLSFLKNLSLLQYISLFSITIVAFYTLTFSSLSSKYSSKVLVLPEYWNYALPGVPPAMGAIFLSFSVHHGALQLFKSLNNNTLARFLVSLKSSLLISSVIYYIVIISIYVSFAGVISSNILNNYCLDDDVIVFVRLLFSNIVTFCLILLIFTVSFIFKSIGPILAISGSLCGTPINMIFPSLIYMSSIQKSFTKLNFETVFNWTLVFDMVCMLIDQQSQQNMFHFQ
ncbi:hypothetical protein HZS_1272 [Henneguya salminicola]|nr:hypothetical protein HZS_1272 [Henneguya salminicola]